MWLRIVGVVAGAGCVVVGGLVVEAVVVEVVEILFEEVSLLSFVVNAESEEVVPTSLEYSRSAILSSSFISSTRPR